MDISQYIIDTTTINFINTKTALHYRIIPFKINHTTIEIFIQEGTRNKSMLEELEILFGKSILAKEIDTISFESLFNKHYNKKNEDTRQSISYYSGASDNFLNDLLLEAKRLNSSDIHIEIYEDKCRVRIRIDGKLVIKYQLQKKEYPTLINKIKILSNLDIAEKRLPQDGRISINNEGGKTDIRVSSLPTLYGEKIVLRILKKDTTNLALSNLGFSNDDHSRYLDGIKRPNGILLISGPTGSGKTTTLYATLKELNKSSQNILTIEDPIEYTLEGVNQVQLKESIGLTFSSALRTFLRQDPDVIMIGEIRDVETANMAIRAALTGHLVLSTIHTNSAWGIISRLTDMGVPPYLVANTLNTAVAQRLVRILCPDCKRKIKFDVKSLPKQFILPNKLNECYESVGCENCHNTGYKSRKAIYEVLPITQEISKRIKECQLDIIDYQMQNKLSTLSQTAYALFENGATSVDEIYPILMQ